MMMIAPNCHVRQKEGEEEEEGDRRKRGQTGTPTPGADAPTWDGSHDKSIPVQKPLPHGMGPTMKAFLFKNRSHMGWVPR